MAAPIALTGTEAGHAIVNALFGSPRESSELFAGGAYGLIAVAASIVLGLVVLGVCARVVGVREPASSRRAVALLFTFLPPAAFIGLELGESLARGGTPEWKEFLGRTFLMGLALQLPLALLGYLAARALTRLGDGVRRALAAGSPLRIVAPAPLPTPRAAADLPRPTLGRARFRGRAPPLVLASS